MESIYEPIETELKAFTQPHLLAPELWRKFHLDGLDNVDFSKWERVKMMDENGDLSDETKKITAKYGGIYLYSIEPDVIPECGCYIMYIGKATKTQNWSLRTRVRSYKNQFGKDYSRPRIHNLFKRWGKYVYVHYLPVQDSNEVIEELETRLIACIVPPCNPEIRDAAVKREVKAFSTF